MAAKVRSDLQQKLEAEGWEFLTNEGINHDLEYDDGFGYKVRLRLFSKSDSEIRRLYQSASFKAVMVTDAYDVKGEPLGEMRAVYVMRQN